MIINLTYLKKIQRSYSVYLIVKDSIPKYLKVVPIIRVTDSAYKCDSRKGEGVGIAFPRRSLWVFNEGDNHIEDLRGQKLETDVGLR